MLLGEAILTLIMLIYLIMLYDKWPSKDPYTVAKKQVNRLLELPDISYYDTTKALHQVYRAFSPLSTKNPHVYMKLSVELFKMALFDVSLEKHNDLNKQGEKSAKKKGA